MKVLSYVLWDCTIICLVCVCVVEDRSLAPMFAIAGGAALGGAVGLMVADINRETRADLREGRRISKDLQEKLIDSICKIRKK